MAGHELTKKPGPWTTLVEFVATYLPERDDLPCAGEMLGADRRAAVFATWLRAGQIEARGLYRGLGSMRPLLAELYSFSEYTQGRLGCPPLGWWARVEVRFTVAPAEVDHQHGELGLPRPPGRPSNEGQVMAEFDARYPADSDGKRNLPPGGNSGAAAALKKELSLDEGVTTIAGWIGNHLRKLKKRPEL